MRFRQILLLREGKGQILDVETHSDRREWCASKQLDLSEIGTDMFPPNFFSFEFFFSSNQLVLNTQFVGHNSKVGTVCIGMPLTAFLDVHLKSHQHTSYVDVVKLL